MVEAVNWLFGVFAKGLSLMCVSYCSGFGLWLFLFLWHSFLHFTLLMWRAVKHFAGVLLAWKRPVIDGGGVRRGSERGETQQQDSWLRPAAVWKGSCAAVCRVSVCACMCVRQPRNRGTLQCRLSFPLATQSCEGNQLQLDREAEHLEGVIVIFTHPGSSSTYFQ